MFTPFSSPFPKTFPVVATGWWLAGGIAPASCVAAYRAKGAESQARSYVNLASPGTYDLTVGAAIGSWGAANGWVGNGSGYLKTGIVPAGDQSWSLFVRFSDLPGSSLYLCGSRKSNSTNSRFRIVVNSTPNLVYGNGGLLTIALAQYLANGVLGIAGATAYRNGTAEAGSISAWDDTASEIYLLCNNGPSGAEGFVPSPGAVQAVAIYRAALTAAQAAALTAAMNLL